MTAECLRCGKRCVGTSKIIQVDVSDRVLEGELCICGNCYSPQTAYGGAVLPTEFLVTAEGLVVWLEDVPPSIF